METEDTDHHCCSLDEYNASSACVENSLIFSTSLDAEPAVIEEGIYSYERNAISPKFNDTDTSVEEVDDDVGGTIVLSTTQPLRPYFKVNGYGLHTSQWPVSDTEFYSEHNPAERYYSSYSKASSQRGPRRPVGKVSTVLVAWNVLNMMMNLSILAMPFAVAIGGVIALAIIPVIGIMSGYSGKLLIDCMYEHSTRRPKLKRRIRLDYIELGMDFLNQQLGGKIIHGLQILDMLAACILNVNVLGALCYEVLGKYLSIRFCSVIGVAIAMPTFFIKKLNFIAWMQMAAVISLAVGLSLVEGYALANISFWSISKIPILDLEKIPISIGIIICAFGIHPALPGIEQQMSKPKQYRPMLVFTFSLAIIVKMFVAVTNALMYGRSTDQVITIDLKYHYGLGMASAVFIFISVLCFFALPTFVIMEGIDNAIVEMFPFFRERENKYRFWLSLLTRLTIMGVSLAFAILIPHFALLMAFFGNTLSTLLSLTIPCMFHLKLKRDRLRWYHYIFNTLVIIMSIISMITGVIFTCKELHRRLR